MLKCKYAIFYSLYQQHSKRTNNLRFVRYSLDAIYKLVRSLQSIFFADMEIFLNEYYNIE